VCAGTRSRPPAAMPASHPCDRLRSATRVRLGVGSGAIDLELFRAARYVSGWLAIRTASFGRSSYRRIVIRMQDCSCVRDANPPRQCDLDGAHELEER